MAISEPLEFRQVGAPKPRPAVTQAKCSFAEAFEQRLEPLLAGLPEHAAKVPPEQVEVLFNQLKVHVYDAWEVGTLEAPAQHANAAGRRVHPCLDDSVKVVMRRLRVLRAQLIAPRLNLESQGPGDVRVAPLVLGIECALPSAETSHGMSSPMPNSD